MSATTTPGDRSVPPHRRVGAALAAEWIKLRSLRSVLAVPLLAAVCCLGLADLVCANYVSNWSQFDAARQSAFVPFDVNFGFMVVGVLFFGVLGALVVTSEYGTGLIRSTLAATPQRGLVLAAKAALLTGLALVTAAAICLTAFLTGQGVLAGRLPHVGLGDPGVAGRLLGAVFYLTAVALLGLSVGVLARSTAVAMSALVGLLLVLPIMVNSLPHDAVWQHTVPYLPSNLGNALWHSHGDGVPGAGTAALLLAAYVVVLGAVAAFSLRRRDA
ncbi:ABC transporter permease [Kitasatospora sp. NPDC058965]|uniref:ABC transporter permease n=1 Tax=Kitasatospora sp. NPDC058965 TaxID=3346682 RepID=UPI003694496B